VSGSLAYLKYHRHLTHSLLMAPVMALLPLLVVRLVSRKPMAWRAGYLASLAGLASHLLLDLTNVYGVRLLLPFSGRWLRLDITPVVDPWIWGALLLAVIAPALARLVGSEIGASTRPGRGAATLVLAFLLLYDGARAVLHARAMAMLDSRIYDGSPPRHVAAFPDTFNPFAWRGVVQGEASYTLLDVNVREPFDPMLGTSFYQPNDNAVIHIASGTEAFRVFLDFSQYPVWTIAPELDRPGGLRVQMVDLRFGTPRRPGFVAVAILDEQSRVVRSWFSFLRATPR
jgi:inner membrane protein